MKVGVTYMKFRYTKLQIWHSVKVVPF